MVRPPKLLLSDRDFFCDNFFTVFVSLVFAIEPENRLKSVSRGFYSDCPCFMDVYNYSMQEWLLLANFNRRTVSVVSWEWVLDPVVACMRDPKIVSKCTHCREQKMIFFLGRVPPYWNPKYARLMRFTQFHRTQTYLQKTWFSYSNQFFPFLTDKCLAKSGHESSPTNYHTAWQARTGTSRSHHWISAGSWDHSGKHRSCRWLCCSFGFCRRRLTFSSVLYVLVGWGERTELQSSNWETLYICKWHVVDR